MNERKTEDMVEHRLRNHDYYASGSERGRSVNTRRPIDILAFCFALRIAEQLHSRTVSYIKGVFTNGSNNHYLKIR